MIRLRQKDNKFVIYKIPLISKKASKSFDLEAFLCGAYGTRTRDPMRDRHVF